MGNKWQFVQGAMQFYNFLEGIEASGRARASEQRAIAREEEERQSRLRAEQMQLDYFNNPVASDKLGAGRLGNLSDAQQDNLLDKNGLFLGALEGKPIFYSGDAHLLNYGLTRSGKGRDIVLPNLAHVFNRSLVVNDIKDGENCFASAEYRKAKGHRIVALNPYGLLGFPSYKYNPFQRIINRAQRGESVTEDCLQICMTIVPPTKGNNDWVAKGSQQILATWLEWSARFRPDRCTLSNMWRFANLSFEQTLTTILNCGHAGLEGQANNIIVACNAEGQQSAYVSEITTGLWNFRPDSELAIATESSDFNPEELRHEKTTLYIMGKSEVLEASSQWVSLMISSIVDGCAHERGQFPVTFLIDEFANLPYMTVLPKALTVYAGKGVQLWGLCQGRAALLAKGYSDANIKNFESQSGIMHMWSVKETDLLKDIETWSGNTAVATKGMNLSGGAVASGGFGISEQKRPVLQSEDILKVGDGKQIIRTNGAHLYVADRVPWFEVPSWKDKLRDVRKIHYGFSEQEIREQQKALESRASLEFEKPPVEAANNALSYDKNDQKALTHEVDSDFEDFRKKYAAWAAQSTLQQLGLSPLSVNDGFTQLKKLVLEDDTTNWTPEAKRVYAEIMRNRDIGKVSQLTRYYFHGLEGFIRNTDKGYEILEIARRMRYTLEDT